MTSKEERIAAIKASAEKDKAKREARKQLDAKKHALKESFTPEELRDREVCKEILMVPPEDLIVIGVDCFGKLDDDGNPRPHRKGEHSMWKASINEAIDQMTVETMKLPGIGIIEAVQARRIDGRLVVNNGRTRVRHARVANEQLRAEGRDVLRVKVIVIMTDEIVSAGAAIIANAHRRDADVPELAEELGLFIELGKTLEEAAFHFKKDLQTIKNWMLFLEAPIEAQIAAIEKKIPSSAVIDLARRMESSENPLSREGALEILKGWIQAGGVSSTEAKRQIRQKKDGVKDPAAIKPPKRSELKRFYAAAAKNETGLSEDFIKGVQWADGQIAADKIKGLTSLIKKSA